MFSTASSQRLDNFDCQNFLFFVAVVWQVLLFAAKSTYLPVSGLCNDRGRPYISCRGWYLFPCVVLRTVTVAPNGMAFLGAYFQDQFGCLS